MSLKSWGAGLALAAAAWAASGAAAAAGYVVFAVPQAVEGTYPVARNASGDVTGYYLDASLLAHGFLRKASGEIVTFDFPGSLPQLSTTPATISDDGTISGTVSYLQGAPAVPVVQGFRRAPDGSFTAFAVPGTIATFVTGGNRAGQLTGYVYEAGSDAVNGYVTTAANYDVFSGGDAQELVPEAINDLGEVAGTLNFKRGFLRSSGGTLAYFTVPASPLTPGNPYLQVSGLNSQGAMVGWAYNRVCPHLACYDLQVRGFVRQRDGQVTTFQVSDRPTNAYAINSTGQVTGTYQVPGGQGGPVQRGFIRSAQGSVTTFQVPQMTATYGVAIGDDGVVLGRCRNASGQSSGFVRMP